MLDILERKERELNSNAAKHEKILADAANLPRLGTELNTAKAEKA